MLEEEEDAFYRGVCWGVEFWNALVVGASEIRQVSFELVIPRKE